MSDRRNYLDEIAHTIRLNLGCNGTRIETVAVKEVFKGAVAWDGLVEVFSLEGHPKAKKCYAWGHEHAPGKWEITTVLEIPPVTSPQTAVKVAIAAHIRKK